MKPFDGEFIILRLLTSSVLVLSVFGLASFGGSESSAPSLSSVVVADTAPPVVNISISKSEIQGEETGILTLSASDDSDVVKLAHIIGDDSRTTDFFSSTGYYNSSLQAQIAKNNLSHVKCKNGDGWDKNSTSGFFVDVEDFAKNNNIAGNFSSCRNKVLVTVAHYINDRGGESGARCKVYRSFDTGSSPLELGVVKAINTGGEKSDAYNLDFAFVKIDHLRNSEIPNFKTLKVCSEYTAIQNFAGSRCDAEYKDDIILPHLALSKVDPAAADKGLNYKAKLSSGKCCISGRASKFDGLLNHTCDMVKRSSGAPLLSISGTGEPCVLGVQKGQSLPEDRKGNYAVSVADTSFRSQFKNFIQQNCSASEF